MRRESGQAAVETAMVMPLMVFLTLGTIQLTMMQQARLMTEYAAYQAARAGIVWNGHNDRMHDAAIVALLPTIGRSDSWGEAIKTWTLAQAYEASLTNAMRLGGVGGIIPDTVNGANVLGHVRIDTVSPAYWDAVGSIWKISDYNWKEIDFDGTDTFPMDEEKPSIWQRVWRKFVNVQIPDKEEVDMRKVTVLSIRVRYWYEMRVPFANAIIFQAWYAATTGRQLYGAIDRATTDPTVNMMNREGNDRDLVATPGRIEVERGWDTVYPLEMPVLWALSKGSVPLVSGLVGKKYFIPLTATYSMRMQSNFNRKWIMHLDPDWNL